MNSSQTLQELRRHLTDFEKVLLDWKQAIFAERRTMENATEVETIPLEQLDCREMLKMSLIMERIEFMELELSDMNRDISKLENLEKNLYSV